MAHSLARLRPSLTALALTALATLACRTVVIVSTQPTPGPPPPTATPAPPVEPTYAPGVVTVEATLPRSAPAAGAPMQIVTPAPTPEGPTLPHPLYFLSDREGRAQVYLFAGNGTAARRITNELFDVKGYALDPNGEFLVAYTDRRVLVVYNQRRFDTLDIGSPGLVVRGIALSPDGERLAFWTDTLLSIYAVGPTGQRFLRLVQGAPLRSAAWNADSITLAYAAQDGVHLLDVETARDDLALAAEDGVAYHVEGASPDGRWFLASTAQPDGECLAWLIAATGAVREEAAAQTFRCPLTFSPDGAFALWTPLNPPTIQVTRLQAGAPAAEAWRATTVIADYAAYAPSWVVPETFVLWTCAFRGETCPPGTLDLYAGAWPAGRLTLWWDSDDYRVTPQDGGAAPVTPLWETFAVAAESRASDSTVLLVVERATGMVNVVATEGNNWAPQWFTLR